MHTQSTTAPTIVWRIVPEETPKLSRRCRRCDEKTDFSSSERFRVNANGPRIDVWLVYLCARCSASWKHPIIERQTVASIGSGLYERYMQNDRKQAWVEAFRAARTMGGKEDQVRFRIEGPEPPEKTYVARFAPDLDVRIRLDRALSVKLDISRSQLWRLDSTGDIAVVGGSLKSTARSEIEIRVFRSARPGQMVEDETDQRSREVDLPSHGRRTFG